MREKKYESLRLKRNDGKLLRKLSEKWQVGDDAVSRKLLSIRRRVENEADEKGKCGIVGRKRMQKQ